MKKYIFIGVIILLLGSIYALQQFGKTKNFDSMPDDTPPDTIVFHKNDDKNSYYYNLTTKTIGGVKTNPDINKFTGLPTPIETNKTLVQNQDWIDSIDSSRIIVYSSTHDKTQPISEFGGDYPTVKETYYLCDTHSKQCDITHILDYTNQKAPELKGCWFEWDSQRNWFFASPCGEGGGSNYIAKYDASKKLITKVGNDYPEQGKISNTIAGRFSKSLNKFLMLSTDVKTKMTSILIYDTYNMSKPTKSFDVTNIIDESATSSSVWNRNEDIIYYSVAHKIYSIDIVKGKITLLTTDPTFDIYDINISHQGGYLVYISHPEGNGIKQTMKALDLTTNKSVELLQEDFINFDQS